MSFFKTNPTPLKGLLEDAEGGKLKLPEFQRSWVWDEDRIKSLIASVSQAFPIGAVMTLQTGGEVKLKERSIEGAPIAADAADAQSLILDGQQRITSLYQACLRDQVIETITSRKKGVKRWFYIDMRQALDPDADREEAIIGVPEDRVVRKNFGRDVALDLSTPEKEYKERMFPVWQVFDWGNWQSEYFRYWNREYRDFDRFDEETQVFGRFRDSVLENFKTFALPLIEMPSSTDLQAVCLVFEKVNTGGQPLDTFELVTAKYAASGFDLRQDWLGTSAQKGRYQRLKDFNRVLKSVSAVDFLQTVSLLATSQLGERTSATRKSLLTLPLEHYRQHSDLAHWGFQEASKFLGERNIFRPFDLPYRQQLIPLAAILATLGNKAENATVRERIATWYWSGVFGELYGSASETRFAKDVVEVPRWCLDEEQVEPTTCENAVFRADRLLTLRTRVSAAYKGVTALLMSTGGAKDWLSGKAYTLQLFFDEAVDIHHIFPRAWCRKAGIPDTTSNSVINKTPLSARTNRKLGGDAPSKYLTRLEQGTADQPAIATNRLDQHLLSHKIASDQLRADDFDGFFRARQEALLSLIETAMNKQAFRETGADEPETDIPDEEDEAF